MTKQTVEAWKRGIKEQYRTSHVYPANSFSARGAQKVGRRLLANVKSPAGGIYSVFSIDTAARRKAAYGK